MSNPELTRTERLERLAEESGLAIAVAGEGGRQIAAFNNNSICAKLNPDTKFSAACARFCGMALEKAREAGKTVGFVCHAGLDCRAFIPAGREDKQVVIIGRTFLKAENYRKATERAITGDWKTYAPAELFENILLTGSADVLNKATQEAVTIFRPAAIEPPVIPSPQRIEVSEVAEPRVVPAPVKPAIAHGTQPAGETSILVERFNRELGLQPIISVPKEKKTQPSKQTTPPCRNYVVGRPPCQDSAVCRGAGLEVFFWLYP